MQVDENDMFAAAGKRIEGRADCAAELRDPLVGKYGKRSKQRNDDKMPEMFHYQLLCGERHVSGGCPKTIVSPLARATIESAPNR